MTILEFKRDTEREAAIRSRLLAGAPEDDEARFLVKLLDKALEAAEYPCDGYVCSCD